MNWRNVSAGVTGSLVEVAVVVIRHSVRPADLPNVHLYFFIEGSTRLAGLRARLGVYYMGLGLVLKNITYMICHQTHRFPGFWTGDPALTPESAPSRVSTLSACPALTVILGNISLEIWLYSVFLYYILNKYRQDERK